MRLARTSAVVALFLLAPLAQIEAQAPAGAGQRAGGFNPVPYLGSDVDKAKDAYDDAQDNRNLAMDKLRAAMKDYGHAASRLEVRDNAETEAAFDKAKNAYDAAKADYTKARKRRDDASETFFKVRTAAERASRANAPPEPPMPLDAPVGGPAAATAPAMTQEQIDAAWHRWTDATIKEWQAQRAERAALDAAEAARKTARAAPTDTAAASAYLDAVKKAQAAAEATEAARAAVPTAPTGPGGTANSSAPPPVETKPVVPAPTVADADKAQAARATSDAERAAADDKAWKARTAAQAAAERGGGAAASGADGRDAGARISTLTSVRARRTPRQPPKPKPIACGTRTLLLRPIALRATLSGDEAPIRDDGEDPDDPFADLNQALDTGTTSRYGSGAPPTRSHGTDDDPDPVPMTAGPDDRMLIDDVDHTPAPATTESSPSAQPTAEQLHRAAQLYPSDSAQGGVFVPAPLAPAAPLIATVPVATRAVQAQTSSTRTAAQIPATSPTPTPATVPGAATTPTNPGPGQPVSAVTPPVAKPPPSGFGGSWSGDGGCGFSTMTISDQGSSLLLQGLPGNGVISATARQIAMARSRICGSELPPDSQKFTSAAIGGPLPCVA